MSFLSILRWNFFFCRNNLFTRDFDWYKLPSFPQIFTTLYSPDTFNNTESNNHNRIVLLTPLYNLSQSSYDIPMGFVPRSTSIHWSCSTRRASILSFHSSKFWPLNFLISILKLLTILFQCTNQHCKSPTQPRLITNPISIKHVEPSATKEYPDANNRAMIP